MSDLVKKTIRICCKPRTPALFTGHFWVILPPVVEQGMVWCWFGSHNLGRSGNSILYGDFAWKCGNFTCWKNCWWRFRAEIWLTNKYTAAKKNVKQLFQTPFTSRSNKRRFRQNPSLYLEDTSERKTLVWQSLQKLLRLDKHGFPPFKKYGLCWRRFPYISIPHTNTNFRPGMRMDRRCLTKPDVHLNPLDATRQKFVTHEKHVHARTQCVFLHFSIKCKTCNFMAGKIERNRLFARISVPSFFNNKIEQGRGHLKSRKYEHIYTYTRYLTWK